MDTLRSVLDTHRVLEAGSVLSGLEQIFQTDPTVKLSPLHIMVEGDQVSETSCISDIAFVLANAQCSSLIRYTKMPALHQHAIPLAHISIWLPVR
jgi:hypothetical protein